MPDDIVEKHWYRTSFTWLTFLLLPFSWLFRLIVAIRFFLYRTHFLKKTNFTVPVIVVGNITVGGTGKTPFVIWLAKCLQKKGYRPGIVSRGVGGEKISQPYWIDAMANPQYVGDEAVLLAKRTQCPMVVCVDRVAAVNELLKKTNCNMVISDDGLQHYHLGRSMEIIVVDGIRELGNGQLIPAGPLREPVKRLREADLIIINGKSKLHHPIFKSGIVEKKLEHMNLEGDILFSLIRPDQTLSLDIFSHKKIHAIAGIGHPERFFSLLRDYGIHLIEHVFPDHYLYQRDDIYFADDLPVIMTEKDAVKCMEFADPRHWYLPVDAKMSSNLEKKILSFLGSKYASI